MAARESGIREESKGEGGKERSEIKKKRIQNLNGGSQKGAAAAARGKSWLSVHGEKGFICSLFTPNTNCGDAVSFQVFLHSSTGVDIGLD